MFWVKLQVPSCRHVRCCFKVTTQLLVLVELLMLLLHCTWRLHGQSKQQQAMLLFKPTLVKGVCNTAITAQDGCLCGDAGCLCGGSRFTHLPLWLLLLLLLPLLYATGAKKHCTLAGCCPLLTASAAPCCPV
jgi:hypothetical protein